MKSGTSHEDWVRNDGSRLYKVTVDCPKAPFSQDLITSMARQAGVNKKEIYRIYFGCPMTPDSANAAANKLSKGG
jgi:hypothetical protein